MAKSAVAVPSAAAGHSSLFARGVCPRAGQVPTTVLLAGIVALATMLRLLFLGRLSLEWDEGISVSYVLAPWRDYVDTLLHHDTNMGLYHVLLRLWVSLGTSEFAVRCLSVVLSVATVPVVYLLGKRMFGVRVGLVAALLLAVNAFHIRFAQEARGYSLVVLLVSLSSLWFLIAMLRPSRGVWAAYVVTTTLAVFSHTFALLVPAAQGTSLLFLRRRDIPWKAVLISAVALGLVALPFEALVASHFKGGIDWIPRPTLHWPFRLLVNLAGAGAVGPGGQGTLLALPEVARRLLWLTYLSLCAAALVRAGSLWIFKPGSPEAWYRGIVVSWLAVPAGLAFGVSAVKPMFLARYLIICLPALVLLAALGIEDIARRWVRGLALVAVAGLAGGMVVEYYTYVTKENWRGATQYILAHTQPGDRLVFYASDGQAVFRYYLDRLTKPALGVPRFVEDSDVIRPRNGLMSNRSRRVWLVLSHDRVLSRAADGVMRRDTRGELIRASLSRNHPLIHEEVFDGIRVLLYGPADFGLATLQPSVAP